MTVAVLSALVDRSRSGWSRKVLWRFDGEYWWDEVGRYRQAITSKCAR